MCLKLMRGSVVVVKGVRKNDLHALEGAIVSGSVSTTEEIVLSKTKIWYRRLGQVSEKDLVEFQKEGLCLALTKFIS